MSFDEPFQSARGDRASLSLDEQFLLENKILPTARRWCVEKPGLRDHGAQTLTYWGEPVPPLKNERARS